MGNSTENSVSFACCAAIGRCLPMICDALSREIVASPLQRKVEAPFLTSAPSASSQGGCLIRRRVVSLDCCFLQFQTRFSDPMQSQFERSFEFDDVVCGVSRNQVSAMQCLQRGAGQRAGISGYAGASGDGADPGCNTAKDTNDFLRRFADLTKEDFPCRPTPPRFATCVL